MPISLSAKNGYYVTDELGPITVNDEVFVQIKKNTFNDQIFIFKHHPCICDHTHLMY